MMKRYAALALSAVIASAVGCDTGPRTHPVRGAVTIDGQPAPENTRVNFQPVDDTGEMASGIVDAAGNYTLYTGIEGRSGALEGRYKVYLTPDASGTDYMEGGPPGPGAVPGMPASPFPDEYSRADTSPIEVEVTAGNNTIDIEI